ncbi:Transcriptional regulator of nonfermentable carbon utilization [Dimargaris cristalligena]|nr:Transcriptional regulator of nonfermentable carbon utilization [Dimargaris cristalligena]
MSPDDLNQRLPGAGHIPPVSMGLSGVPPPLSSPGYPPLSMAGLVSPPTTYYTNPPEAGEPRSPSAPSSPDHSPASAGPRRSRRRKATRACLDCQRAHLTCDDGRPCQRCVKRGLAVTCRDGFRKTAKYLLEDDQETLVPPADSHQRLSSSPAGLHPPAGVVGQLNFSPPTLAHHTTPLVSPLVETSGILNVPLPGNYGFGSESTNLEYNMLSSILNNSVLNSVSHSNPPAGLPGMEMADIPWPNINGDPSVPLGLPFAAAPSLANPNLLLMTPLPPSNGGPSQNSPHTALGAPTSAEAGLITRSLSGRENPACPISSNGTYRTSADVYSRVTEPFRYVDGFHFLMRLIRDRMSKEDAVRISRAMSQFRPTFIAMNMNLTTEDLVFVEKSFQRTLMEFEKLISYSGTPTVVWRRTGEIALVGKEFAMLTGWTKEQLLGACHSSQPDPATSHRYIFELMDNPSVVDYWEKFAQHAYGDSEHSVMSTCQLRRPDQRTVPCTLCFTIRRDIFDIPLAIIGNFLPILS